MVTLYINRSTYFFLGGQIPDANMIHAIRKKRQQAREQGDMIPIDDTVRYGILPSQE